ncbi:hypothetical protein SLS62_005090 [Diatrype stigma]|uniref:Uncharacterized protein n=1 Tax=Diatrype stigma TaxID=117547 RepID=A0AAN9YPY7_9PEZI
MAKWKELGEVPDSDEESELDSQELIQELPQPNPTLDDNGNDDDAGDGARDELHSHNATPPVNRLQQRDIWDIPPSSPPDQVNNVPASGSAWEPPPPPSTPPGPQSSPPVLPPEEVVGTVVDHQPPQQPSEPIAGEDEGTVAGEHEGPVPTATANIATEFVDALDGNLGSTQEAVRYSRSLRPRKPIQEHPYLLESAQYSKALKSHGVRPIRLQIEEAARRRREEEDSQEQDYEDDSQSTAKEPAVEESGESQALNEPDPFDEPDELALSPVRRASSPPHRNSRPEDLLRSSQDEEEFPDPTDIAKWKSLSTSRNTNKRHASPKMSAKKKVPKNRQSTNPTVASPLRRTFDIFDIPPSPPQTSPALFSTTPRPNTRDPRATTTLTPKPSSVISSRNQSPSPATRTPRVVDLTIPDDQNDDSEGDEVSSSTSEDETDVLLQNSRRIRGVLPASWLRIDQQAPRSTPKGPSHQQRRSLDKSPEKSHRKGVAQRRQVSPKPTMDTPFFFDDSDNDDDFTNLRLNEHDDTPNNSTTFPIFEDDAGSVVEEDHIDRMLPGSKRPSLGNDGQGRPKKKRKGQQSTFKGQSTQRTRQQRITGLLGRTKSVSSVSHSKDRKKHSSGATRHTKEGPSTSARPRTPPRLSILDVAEPDAPAFIRLAARAARRRPDKGRTSPSTKRISLGTRKDHLEATEVLRDWKRGKIQPRVSVDGIDMPRHADHPVPLQSVSHNSAAPARPQTQKPRVHKVIPSSRFSRPAHSTKQASMDNFVNVEADMVSELSDPTDIVGPLSKRKAPNRRRNLESTSRPAQLEAIGESVGRNAFTARKKALDALYRKSRRPLPVPGNIRLERVMENNATVSNTQSTQYDMSFGETPEPLEVPEPATNKRLKSRKRTKPRHLDTSAPQYAHANDPLPRERSPGTDIVTVSETSDKLLGLGPFGTHYTQHFEVFPLDSGVFFHESTLVGSGRLAKALDSSLDNLNHSRRRAIFVLDEKNLQWGSWDGQTSSELGIVCDWIVDQLSSATSEGSSGSVVRAALFILEYCQDSLSFPDQPSQNAFVHRALEVLQSYSQRLGALPSSSDSSSQPLMQVLSCCILTVFQVLRICQKFDMFTESFKLEELLKDTAKHASKRLLQAEFADIRSLYDDLQRMSYRERGIREDQASAICWVVLMRVLEGARIPRSGFWDIVSPMMLGTNAMSIVDAHALERAWQGLFTLLPLGEFDSAGVLIPGLRHTMPLEGWWLPQQLLSRIFQLYKSNPRQSPTFNDYCRGVVARCHYLVEHWGWRKCNGIIGTIFDFFASQDLSHLRNEEAYRSPQFLEDLAASPSLAILPEDRCFHIFLKLLALSIKRLRKFGLIKDVRNLIARVLPNHDRHYVKEKDMHETELAALRNHHDLLCTLFWAAPPDLRPSTQLIEKLVVPGSSHKEACLVNLRAWNQLARFIVSSGEDISAYKPFAEWQRSVFQQVLDQYSSAESDIQQQFLRLSKDSSRSISQDLMNSVVKANKKASMDVLHFSMKALLERKVAAPFLSMARNVIRMDFAQSVRGSALDRIVCLEETVSVAARVAARLIHAKLAGVRTFFSSGKLCIFEGLPRGVATPARKFLPLFLATMIKKEVVDFMDVGATTIELFLGAITKPFQYLAYENRLAEALKHRDDPYLTDAFIEVGKGPDYNSNRDLFSHAISRMRKSLRFAEPSQRQQLQPQFAKTLRAVMDQIKQDLKLMVSSPPEHANYIDFVRSIVAIIRAQDICPVDPYFYQISPEYSPSRQDPRLQTAGILACGLKLEEGNAHAASSLFYLLWPNFTTALANGKLADEQAILAQGMQHPHVLAFMLGKMFPAIIRTAVRKPEGWVLIETYVGALERWLTTGPAVHREIGEADMDGALALLRSVDIGVRHLGNLDIRDLHTEHLHTVVQMFRLANLIGPSLSAYLINDATSRAAEAITRIAGSLAAFARAAGSYIAGLLDEPATEVDSSSAYPFTLDPARLFEGIPSQPRQSDLGLDRSSSSNENIDSFSAHMLREMGHGWATITTHGGGTALTVKGPAPRGLVPSASGSVSASASGPAATQSGLGTPIPQWDAQTLVSRLRDQLDAWDGSFGGGGGGGQIEADAGEDEWDRQNSFRAAGVRARVGGRGPSMWETPLTPRGSLRGKNMYANV